MITNIDPPFPDEVFYSWFGRYHRLSGNLLISYTFLDLFNDKHKRVINVSYPTDLNFFCTQIPSSFNTSSDTIVRNNTCFSFFKPFLSKNISDLVLKGMKERTTYQINDMMGVNSGNIFPKNIVKICKQCVKEDKKNVGEGYIHKTHQIPGCFICNKHHILLEYIDLTQTKYFNNFFILDDIIDKVHPFKIDNRILNNLLELTSDIIFLTSKNLNNYDLVKVKNDYNEKLLIKGYLTHNGILRKTELLNDFLDFYSKDYLLFLNSYINDKKYNWLNYISRNKILKTHPIRHLLFIRFLFGGIKEFINFNEKYAPFGKAPWPCLNIRCNHYKQDTINTYELITPIHKNEMIGQFKCNKCGFIYTRSGPDIDRADRYVIRTVEEYGYAWEKSLTDLLLNHTYSLGTLVRRLKCSRGKIISYVRIHNLIHYLAANDQIKIQNEPNNNLFDKYKNTILEYINNNDKATRTEISTSLTKEYALIIRRDKDWFEEIFPAPIKKKKYITVRNDFVDWNKRDLELSIETIKAIDEIKKNTDFRISKKRISHKINAPCILMLNYLSKLPITQKIIKDSFESNEEYLRRKCDYIIKDLFKKGQTITARQLREKLKITIKRNGDLNNHMIKTLLKYTF